MKRLIAIFAAAMALALAPAHADDAVYCLQDVLYTYGFLNGTYDGTIGQETKLAARSFATEHPELSQLTPHNTDEWCVSLLEFHTPMILAEARAWLDDIYANPEGVPAITHPAQDTVLLETLILDAADLLDGIPIVNRFGSSATVTLDITHAVYCPRKDAAAQVRHVTADDAPTVAVLFLCGWVAAYPLSTQVQLLFHEIYHAQLGQGECYAMWFEYWVATLATGTYEFNEEYWDANDCNYRDLVGLPE